jgi:hypothetical protein
VRTLDTISRSLGTLLFAALYLLSVAAGTGHSIEHALDEGDARQGATSLAEHGDGGESADGAPSLCFFCLVGVATQLAECSVEYQPTLLFEPTPDAVPVAAPASWIPRAGGSRAPPRSL